MQLAEVAMDCDNWHSSANVWTNFAKVIFLATPVKIINNKYHQH